MAGTAVIRISHMAVSNIIEVDIASNLDHIRMFDSVRDSKPGVGTIDSTS